MIRWIKNFVMDFDVPGAAVGYILGLLLPAARRRQLSSAAFCAATFANYGPEVVWDDLQKLGPVAKPKGLIERTYLEAELASEYWVLSAPGDAAQRRQDVKWLLEWR